MISSDEDNELIENIAAVGDLEIEIWTSDFQHALLGHPEVTIERIRNALKDPLKVIQSKRNNRTCLFYSLEAKDENLGTIYFCVVVGVIGSGRGKMETAYEADYTKDGTILFQQGEKK